METVVERMHLIEPVNHFLQHKHDNNDGNAGNIFYKISRVHYLY